MHRPQQTHTILLVPLQDVQRHVKLRLIGGWGADQFALGVGRDDGTVGQREPVEGAECVAVPQHCKEAERQETFQHRDVPGAA